jgi:predicted membrane channel-forming protein YqfA (hemolysin III family)
MEADPLLRRVDLFLLLVGGWFVLSLVLASFALMALDFGLGVVALATVMLTLVVGVASYVRTGRSPDVRVELR